MPEAVTVTGSNWWLFATLLIEDSGDCYYNPSLPHLPFLPGATFWSKLRPTTAAALTDRATRGAVSRNGRTRCGKIPQSRFPLLLRPGPAETDGPRSSCLRCRTAIQQRRPNTQRETKTTSHWSEPLATAFARGFDSVAARRVCDCVRARQNVADEPPVTVRPARPVAERPRASRPARLR